MQPILNIDLTTRNLSEFTIPDDWTHDYLGAASLATRILFDTLISNIDPLSPDSPLLFMTGPLTGTAGPAVGRFVVCARSPATGLWGESNCGGFWGPELRKTGFDGLKITGCADSPVYLWINDGVVEIRDAVHIWGLDTYGTQEAVQEELGVNNARIAVIGPAGEHQIPMSIILTDHGRAAGRTGLGAVMGSKNLKAIAVKGNKDIPYVKEAFVEIRKAANSILKDDNFSRVARETGTAGVADYLDYVGEMPKKYYQSGTFDGVYGVSGSTMSESILQRPKACHGCVIACGREVKLSNKDQSQKGPEYETVVGFGPNLLIDDLEFITEIGDRCDRFGVDTISLSNTIGLAFTLFERDLINESHTGGITLNWGDKEVVEKLFDLIESDEGFGSQVTEGARALGRRYSCEDLAVQVNGLEVPYHDPRGATGMALSYATSPRGACHNQSDYFLVDIYGSVEVRLGMAFFNRQDGPEKVNNVIIHQNWRTLFNSLVMCEFANVPPLTVLDLINTATGDDYSLPDILQVGERAWTLKRVINNTLGLDRSNDVLPPLLLEPYPDGGSAGFTIPFDEMIEAYYSARGWDENTGYPSQSKLAELGLDWVKG